MQLMKCNAWLWMLVILTGALLPVGLEAQSGEESPALGDIARALRKEKDKKTDAPTAQTVIDNENFTQIIEQAAKDRQKGKVSFLFDGIGKEIHVSAPDVTCNLSFSADAGALVSNPFAVQDLPRSEMVKLDGPAALNGESLQLTVYNGSNWNLREITVGFTIVRSSGVRASGGFAHAKLVPAAAGEEVATEKHADLTVLYHIKGAAAPFSTAVFQQNLGGKLPSDQEWHWAIVQAQGIPPQ